MLCIAAVAGSDKLQVLRHGQKWRSEKRYPTNAVWYSPVLSKRLGIVDTQANRLLRPCGQPRTERVTSADRAQQPHILADPERRGTGSRRWKREAATAQRRVVKCSRASPSRKSGLTACC
ncbi:hypothetical protein KCP71_11135 [Salmonella enterica subsp. enterica]|nr:hypothetical protein KCP71_11135 [Salmonella enterica subsp. enterica]